MTKRSIPFFLSLLALVCVASAAAQTSRPAASSAPQTTPPATTTQQNTLAVVNGQSISINDIDAQLRDALNNIDQEIANMRRRALTLRVNSLLFEAEAKKRGVKADQLLAEINSRTPAPTEEEVRYVYESNRDQVGSLTLDEARPRIIAAIREQRAQTVLEDFAQRLRMMYVVEWGASDVNTPGLVPTTVLATVAGTPITYGEVNEQLKPSINELRLRLYEAERQAIDVKINEILLDAEAKRRRISRDDLIRMEIFDKLRRPTEADVAKFYEENKTLIQGDLASRRAEIAAFLEQEERLRLEQALSTRLRSTANIRITLPEPAGYTQRISADDDPSRGPVNAPVTVVMFTDFQCPACAATHPVLEEVLKTYGDRVRLVVRDYPLDQHQQARKAAEAANAARAQGKFFEYISILYKNQQALDTASLKKYASDLGLDRARFDADLDGGKFASEVNHDVAEGKAYGVSVTPTIFINGVRLLDLSDRAMKVAIDRAFERAGAKPVSAAGK